MPSIFRYDKVLYLNNLKPTPYSTWLQYPSIMITTWYIALYTYPPYDMEQVRSTVTWDWHFFYLLLSSIFFYLLLSSSPDTNNPWIILNHPWIIIGADLKMIERLFKIILSSNIYYCKVYTYPPLWHGTSGKHCYMG